MEIKVLFKKRFVRKDVNDHFEKWKRELQKKLDYDQNKGLSATRYSQMGKSRSVEKNNECQHANVGAVYPKGGWYTIIWHNRANTWNICHVCLLKKIKFNFIGMLSIFALIQWIIFQLIQR